MKPPGFVYHRPDTVAAALALLHEVGSEGKVLAGGQSLVPLLNMRLVAPAHLVDINRLSELDDVHVTTGDGAAVHVGAMARHADVERDGAAYTAVPLLRRALQHVAHPTIRNRGTTVGSLMHADPSGEMTAVLALLGGWVTVRSMAGSRTIPAAELFVGPMETSIGSTELATSATFPVPGGRTGSAWQEVARRHGDYAVCGVGTTISLDDDLRIVRASAAFVSVGPVPVVVDVTGALAGAAHDSADWGAAGRLAMGRLDPEEDIHASASYRRHLAGVLTARALREAASDAATRARATVGVSG